MYSYHARKEMHSCSETSWVVAQGVRQRSAAHRQDLSLKLFLVPNDYITLSN